MNNIESPSTSLAAHQAALESLQPELERIDPQSLGHYNMDANFAAAVVQAAVQSTLPWSDLIVSLPTIDRAAIERLPTLALALQQANFRVEALQPGTSTFDKDLEEARPVREELLEGAALLARRGKLSLENVQRIRAGVGHRDLINDLGALVTMVAPFQSEGGVVDSNTIRRAEVLVVRLTNALTQRNLGNPELAPMLLQRSKVAALLQRAYNELRAAVAFVRRNDGDADKLTPTLYVVGTRSKKDDDPDADSAPKPAPAPTPDAKPVSPARPLVPEEPSDRPYDEKK
jgi:hypothetical protein